MFNKIKFKKSFLIVLYFIPFVVLLLSYQNCAEKFSVSSSVLGLNGDLDKQSHPVLPTPVGPTPTPDPAEAPKLEDFYDGQTLLVFAHQDDDLLWMLPFWENAYKFILAMAPLTPDHEALIAKHPKEYRDKHMSLWGSLSLDEYRATWKDPLIRQKYLNYETIYAKLEAEISSSNVKRIVTHNPWGEYGHQHHRLLSSVVKDLAIKYKKDVWSMAVLADLKDLTKYTEAANKLPYVEATINENDFMQFRQHYLSQDAQNQGGSNHVTWTWGSGSNDFPKGKQKFIQLVNQGKDLILNDQGVTQQVYALSYYAGGYLKGEFSGIAEMVTKNNVVEKCLGPIPSDGSSYNGILNVPISCDQDKIPQCMKGFRRVLLGFNSFSDGTVEKAFTCEVIDAELPTNYIRGQLYSNAVTVSSESRVVLSCAGSGGMPMNKPMGCQNNQPVCDIGFLLVKTGSIKNDKNGVENYYACQSTTGSSPKEYRRGGLYGFAVLYQDQSSKYVACKGSVTGLAPLPPIKCGSDFKPLCEPGFRRVILGTDLSIAGSNEKVMYFTCEAM